MGFEAYLILQLQSSSFSKEPKPFVQYYDFARCIRKASRGHEGGHLRD